MCQIDRQPVEIERLNDAIQRAARMLSLCEFDQPEDMDDLEFIERVAKAVNEQRAPRPIRCLINRLREEAEMAENECVRSGLPETALLLRQAADELEAWRRSFPAWHIPPGAPTAAMRQPGDVTF